MSYDGVAPSMDVLGRIIEQEAEREAALPLVTRVVLWIKRIDPSDDYRHSFLAAFSDGDYSSAKEFQAEQLEDLLATIDRVQRGVIEIVVREGVPMFLTVATQLRCTDPPGRFARHHNPGTRP